ncbi:hypothetical protein ACE6H2_011098 [Prunus campanulata]
MVAILHKYQVGELLAKNKSSVWEASSEIMQGMQVAKKHGETFGDFPTSLLSQNSLIFLEFCNHELGGDLLSSSTVHLSSPHSFTFIRLVAVYRLPHSL